MADEKIYSTADPLGNNTVFDPNHPALGKQVEILECGCYGGPNSHHVGKLATVVQFRKARPAVGKFPAMDAHFYVQEHVFYCFPLRIRVVDGGEEYPGKE